MQAKKHIKLDPVACVVEKYTENGWTVIQTRGTINDLIAKRGNRIHFVQAMLKDSTDTKYSGEAQNTFIQNAFSNAATPVHARVSTVNRIIAGTKTPVVKIDCMDVNNNSKVIIRAPREPPKTDLLNE